VSWLRTSLSPSHLWAFHSSCSACGTSSVRLSHVNERHQDDKMGALGGLFYATFEGAPGKRTPLLVRW